MLPPAKDSAGARILKKMGWRIGQGIGPRITLRQRRLQDLQATGQTVPADDLELGVDDEEAKKHTYAPRDTAVLLVERKDNFHGLGYRPGMSLDESLGVKGSNASFGPSISGVFFCWRMPSIH
jgi:G patch domain-containing protein 1